MLSFPISVTYKRSWENSSLLTDQEMNLVELSAAFSYKID